jgi:hypothetical protein
MAVARSMAASIRRSMGPEQLGEIAMRAEVVGTEAGHGS